MLPSFLTTFFFAITILVARRAIAYIGPQRANFARQIIGLILLGFYANIVGQGLRGETFWLFFLSGVVGFGLGDWALFEALPRIGPGLTILLCQCLAAPIAALTERVCLGTKMTGMQVGSSAVILVGVGLALAPDAREIVPAGHRTAGVLFGLVAAAGQAWGAVLSRYAFQRAHAIHFAIDGVTAAYQRLWGGALSIGLLLFVGALHSRWFSNRKADEPRPNWRRAWPWVAALAVLGPTLGVSCYQWALQSAPSAIVLPIVATTPLVVMLITFSLQGVRPSRRALVGSLVAVTGVIALVRAA